VAGLLAAGAVAIVSSGDGGSERPAETVPSPAPADAPLDQQLDALDRMVRQAPR
jgi:hypothetical protein